MTNDIVIYHLRYKIYIHAYPGFFKGDATNFDAQWKYLAVPSSQGNVSIFDMQYGKEMLHLPLELLIAALSKK